MPGPFDSSRNKGTFDNDVSTIKQNDVWSSATFNNFVRSVYDVFYRESAYSRVFGNWDKPRLLRGRISSDSETADTPKGCAFGEATYLFHNAVTDAASGTGRVECYPVYHGISPEDAWKWVSHDMSYLDSHGDYDTCAVRFEDEEKLFCGRGDVSLHVKPYALFPVKDSGNTNQAYCCITYEEGDPAGDTSTLQSGQVITPRYSSIAEITFIYDPTRPSDAGISFAKGFPVRTVINPDTQDMSDVCLKLTVTFGADAAFTEFLQRINTDELVTGKIFNAVAVGDPDAGQTLLRAVFNTDSSPDVMTKTVRFVPLRPCIDIISSGKTLRMLTAIPDSLNGTAPDPSQVSIGAYEDKGDGKVFKYPGVYGFIIDNRLSAAAVQTGCRLVYIPNRTEADHYVPVDGTVTTPLLPDWYNDILSKVDSVSTEDFSEEFFFIPFLTVNERTLEIGDYSISLDTILAYGNIIGGVDTGQQQALLESTVVYDASTFTNTDPSVAKPANKRLVEEADKVFGSMVDLFEQDNQGEHRSDTLTSNTQVSALERTLQFLIGLNWKLSDVIFIDPLLGVCTETEAPQSGDPARKYKNTAIDRSRKMYGSINQVIRDEVDGEFGRGSLIHPGTIFVHVTDPTTDQPAYSNDPTDVNWQPLADDPNLPDTFPNGRRNIWREVYAEYLPRDVRHIAVRALSDKTVTDPDFEGFDIDYGYSVLYLRLLQDPNLTDFSSPGWADNWYLPSPATSGDSRGLNHLMCKSALKSDIQRNPKDIDVNSDYYPISGQDFTQTHHTIVEDIFAGARIPSKIPDNKVRLDGIKAGRFTYIPRGVVYKDIISYGSSWSHDPESPWEFESLGIASVMTSGMWTYGGNHLVVPSGSPDNWRNSGWDNSGKLDWLGFNHEVIVNTDCEISSMYQCIDLSVPVNKTGTTSDSGLRIWGSCISFLNSNAAIRNLYVKKGGLPVPGEPEARKLNVPGAGQLMLFKQSEDTSCEAEVSAIQFVGKGGGVQTVVFTPVAWPFAAEWGDPWYLLGSKFSVAYSYSVVKTGTQYSFGTSSSVTDYLCMLSMNSSKYYLDGGCLDLTFNFEDRRLMSDVPAPFDYETRDKSKIRTVIAVTGRVRNCDLFLRITDNYNVYPWASPDKEWASAGNVTVYPAGTWQAFDPDILLGGNAPEITLADVTGVFPDVFTFIDCGLRDSRITGYLTNCKFTVALYDDAVYQEPWRVKFNGDGTLASTQPYYRLNRMFFSSRLFRKSPYIFYFGSSSLPYFTAPCDGSEYATHTFRGIQSSEVDFSIISGSAGWDAATKTVAPGNTSTKTRICLGPVSTEPWGNVFSDDEAVNDSYFPCTATFTFIAGLAKSKITLDDVFVVPTVKGVHWGFPEVGNYVNDCDSVGSGFALFSIISDTDISIGTLDTTFRYVDEWKYAGNDYNGFTAEYEKGNGFMLFTAPAYRNRASGTYRLTKVNVNNKLRVGLWVTSLCVSGIHGLDDSEVSINYSFETYTDIYQYTSQLSEDQGDSLRPAELDAPPAYASVRRPASWGSAYYGGNGQGDVGALYSGVGFTLLDYNPTRYRAVSLLPIFYLAGVNSCNIRLVAAPTGRFVSGLSAALYKYTDAGTGHDWQKELRVRDTSQTLFDTPVLTEGHGAFPNACPTPDLATGGDTGVYPSVRRFLRVAVGYVMIWADGGSPTAEYSEIISSCSNKIHCMASRVNIVSGVFNHVTGWCLELLAIGASPLLAYTAQSSDDVPAENRVLTDTLMEAVNTIVVRRRFTLDTGVCFLGSHMDPTFTRVLYSGLDSRTAGALNLASSSSYEESKLYDSNHDPVNRTAFAHIDAVEFDYLIPYRGSGAGLESKNVADRSRTSYSRSMASMHGGHILAVDAYNTADLRTLLVSTGELTVFGGPEKILPGNLVHTTFVNDLGVV